MKIRVALAVSFSAATALAQVPGKLPPLKDPLPVTAAPVLKTPPELAVPKKQSLFSGAMSRSGLPVLKIPPPPAYAKVTPAAPVTNGARIAKVGWSLYVGATNDMPDGGFLVQAAPAPSAGPGIPLPLPSVDQLIAPYGRKGVIEIELATEANALYVVDCRAQGFMGGNKPVTFSRAGAANQDIALDDGHLVYAFRATTGGALGPRQNIALRFAAETFFFGCEITKS